MTSKGCFGCFVVLVILAVVAGFVLYSYSKVGLTVTQSVQDEIVVDQPLQAVAMNLLLADVPGKIMKELNIDVLKKTPVSQSGEITPMAFLSAKWNIQLVEDQQCLIHNADLGDMTLTMRTTTEAQPKKIVSTAVLSEPSDVLKDFSQVITITPESADSKAPKTRIQVSYTTSVHLPLPAISFISAIAEKRVSEENQRTVAVMLKILKESCENSVISIPGLNIPGLNVVPESSDPAEVPDSTETTPKTAESTEEDNQGTEETAEPVRSFDDLDGAEKPAQESEAPAAQGAEAAAAQGAEAAAEPVRSFDDLDGTEKPAQESEAPAAQGAEEAAEPVRSFDDLDGTEKPAQESEAPAAQGAEEAAEPVL